MDILGIDFTSAPSRVKPITCARCTLDGDVLRMRSFEEWQNYDDFEAALKRPGPWIAGLDFPFGQARCFVENIGWPASWAGYVRHAGQLGRAGFRQELNAYKENRADGDKEHRRATDTAAKSISPQKLHGVPVGLMFFEGAPRLLASGVTIPHVHEGDPQRIAVEAYPGVLARQLIGPRSYKNDDRKKQTRERHDARRDLLIKLREVAPERYGFRIEAPDSLCDDPGGDHLDALLCAVQAAWAWRQRDNRYGAPQMIDPLEGWIADPQLLQAEPSRPAGAPAASPGDTLRLLASGAQRGQRGVLATITGLTGTGARAVGTHMAVLETGESAGSFSSGCVETAIVAEALDVLASGKARTVRFGQGSPYMDIRLPCGGGMDVLFLPDPSPEAIAKAVARLDARQPLSLHLDPAGALSVHAEEMPAGAAWREGIFTIGRVPPLRLVLLGHGAEMLTMLRLARSFGASVEIHSPEEQVVAAGHAEGVPAQQLTSAGSAVSLEGDPWTAFLFLFHDHDWEPCLLKEALATSSFWVGAMGSPRTQAARRAALEAGGVSPEVAARVRGPIGLIPSSRDPATLALSALAEIVGAYHAIPA